MLADSAERERERVRQREERETEGERETERDLEFWEETVESMLHAGAYGAGQSDHSVYSWDIDCKSVAWEQLGIAGSFQQNLSLAFCFIASCNIDDVAPCLCTYACRLQ